MTVVAIGLGDKGSAIVPSRFRHGPAVFVRKSAADRDSSMVTGSEFL
jgi:hypothetical protein